MRKLLVSVHDVSPDQGWRIERLMGLIEELIGPGKAALLAVPHFHHGATIGSDRAFVGRLRAWCEAGSEVFLHGYYHVDDARHAGRLASWKANNLTAGEGEFLGLDFAQARQRLVDGRNSVEDAIGRPVAGFVAPAWLYSADARRAVASLGFPIAEDHFRVWEPATGRLLARGPVITYASRSPVRLLSSLLWSRVAGLALKPMPIVRIGIHPHDWGEPELVSEITRTLRHFARTHSPSHYADLLA